MAKITITIFEPPRVLSCNSNDQTTKPSSTTAPTADTLTNAQNDSYEFIIPAGFVMNNVEGGSVGDAVLFSSSCNPDFVDSSGDSCAVYDGHCNLWEHVAFATKNADGIWESGLQCPGCGCGANGALNPNDVYAFEHGV